MRHMVELLPSLRESFSGNRNKVMHAMQEWNPPVNPTTTIDIPPVAA